MDMYRDVNEMFTWGCLDDGVCFDFGGERMERKGLWNVEWGLGGVEGWGSVERGGGKQKC